MVGEISDGYEAMFTAAEYIWLCIYLSWTVYHKYRMVYNKYRILNVNFLEILPRNNLPNGFWHVKIIWNIFKHYKLSGGDSVNKRKKLSIVHTGFS